MSHAERQSIQSPIVILRSILQYLPPLVFYNPERGDSLTFNLTPLVALNSLRNYLAPHVLHKAPAHVFNTDRTIDYHHEQENSSDSPCYGNPCSYIILNAPTIHFIHTIDAIQFSSPGTEPAEFVVQHSSSRQLRLREFKWATYEGQLTNELIKALSLIPTLEVIEIDVGRDSYRLSADVGYQPLVENPHIRNGLRQLKLFFLSKELIPRGFEQISSFKNLESLTLSHFVLSSPELEDLRIIFQGTPSLQKLGLKYIQFADDEKEKDLNQLGELLSEVCPCLTDFTFHPGLQLDSEEKLQSNKIFEDVLGGLEFLERVDISQLDCGPDKSSHINWNKILSKRCALLLEKEERLGRLRVASKKGNESEYTEKIKNKNFHFALKSLIVHSFRDEVMITTNSTQSSSSTTSAEMNCLNIGSFLGKYCPYLNCLELDRLSLISLHDMVQQGLENKQVDEEETTTTVTILDSLRTFNIAAWSPRRASSSSSSKTTRNIPSSIDCFRSLKHFKGITHLQVQLLQESPFINFVDGPDQKTTTSSSIYKELFQEIGNEWNKKNENTLQELALSLHQYFAKARKGGSSTPITEPSICKELFEGITLLAPKLKSLTILDWNCEKRATFGGSNLIPNKNNDDQEQEEKSRTFIAPLAAISETLTELDMQSSSLFPSTFEDICDLLPNLERLVFGVLIAATQKDRNDENDSDDSDENVNDENASNEAAFALSDFIDIIDAKLNTKLHRLQNIQMEFNAGELRWRGDMLPRHLALKLRSVLMKHPTLAEMSIPKIPFRFNDEVIREFKHKCFLLGIDC